MQGVIVKQIIYDSRWIGEHGIGRFAREIRKRVTGVTMDIYSSDVISASGLLNLEKEIFRISNNRKDLQFFLLDTPHPYFGVARRCLQFTISFI